MAIHCALSTREMSKSIIQWGKLQFRMRIHRNTWASKRRRTAQTKENNATKLHTGCEWSLSFSDQRTTTDCRVPGGADGVASNSLKGKVGGVCVLRLVASGLYQATGLAQLCCPPFSLSLSRFSIRTHTCSTLDIPSKAHCIPGR